MNQYKTCSRCKQPKQLDQFGKHIGTSDGLYSQCLICHREARARYRARNQMAIKQQQSANYAKNKAARIAYANKRIQENPDRHKQYMAISKKRNHIKVAADSRRRRARMKENGIFQISTKEITRLLNQPCFYCGQKTKITVDHVVPIARGGTDSIGNLVPACKSCNSRKRDLLITEWRKKREGR